MSARQSSAKRNVRPPAVAGQFYTDDPGELRAEVNFFIAAAKVPLGKMPKGRDRTTCGLHLLRPYCWLRVCVSGAGARGHPAGGFAGAFASHGISRAGGEQRGRV